MVEDLLQVFEDHSFDRAKELLEVAPFVASEEVVHNLLAVKNSKKINLLLQTMEYKSRKPIDYQEIPYCPNMSTMTLRYLKDMNITHVFYANIMPPHIQYMRVSSTQSKINRDLNGIFTYLELQALV